jgi:hypothetical protein
VWNVNHPVLVRWFPSSMKIKIHKIPKHFWFNNLDDLLWKMVVNKFLLWILRITFSWITKSIESLKIWAKNRMSEIETEEEVKIFFQKFTKSWIWTFLFRYFVISLWALNLNLNSSLFSDSNILVEKFISQFLLFDEIFSCSLIIYWWTISNIEICLISI